jgi:GR25 family glycosyltransferase involved in LPS biosynthesis
MSNFSNNQLLFAQKYQNEFVEAFLDINKNSYKTKPQKNKVGIFIINLKKRPDRLSFIKNEIEKRGIFDYNIVSAVDGHQLSKNELNSLIDNEKLSNVFGSPQMTPGEIGCSASHNLIYKKIISEGYSHALILEDDVALGNNLSHFWETVKNEENMPSFDIVQLGFYLNHDQSMSTNETDCFIGNVRLHKFANDRSIVPIWGTYAYLISNRGARKMLACNEKINFVMDHPWNLFHKYFENFALDPPLAVQNGKDFGSDITDRSGRWPELYN